MDKHSYCRFCHPELSPLGHNRPHAECECRLKCIPCVEKRIRAEVLAACIQHFEKKAAECADFANKETGEARAAWNREESWYEDCIDDLKELQPAAKDLEELLREAELKIRQDVKLWFDGRLGQPKGRLHVEFYDLNDKRIAELEKARDEGKG